MHAKHFAQSLRAHEFLVKIILIFLRSREQTWHLLSVFLRDLLAGQTQRLRS